MKNSIIDTNDMSGDSFLQTLVQDNPPLFNDYIVNAGNGGCYDFKETNGIKGATGYDHYRGMPIGKTGDGLSIFASARDVGNIGAGYIAAVNGLSWKQARVGFDGYQSYKSKGLVIEGKSTQLAEEYGFRMGYNNTPTNGFSINLRSSISEGLGYIWNWIKVIF